MLQMLRQTLGVLILLAVITGLAYPLVITGIAQVAFPHQANGSLVVRGGKTIGSELIGQPFTAAGYFWSRPSATTPMPYNAANSGGSNLGPLNPDLQKQVADRVAALRAADPNAPAAALVQAPRIAKARGLDEGQVRQLIDHHTQGRQLGVLGEPRVNVLALNLALDDLAPPRPPESRPHD
jgi:K+-transporting ATPase ATPase C chain